MSDDDGDRSTHVLVDLGVDEGAELQFCELCKHASRVEVHASTLTPQGVKQLASFTVCMECEQ